MYKVALIDDEAVVLEGLNKMIDWKTMGCKVVGQAEDGESGLFLVRELRPDIVLTDIRMPKLDGLDMVNGMKESAKESRIIILTGYREFEYAQRGISLGVFRFLLKPTKKQDIIRAVKEAIEDIEEKRDREREIHELKEQVSRFYGFKHVEPIELKIDEEDDGSNYLALRAIKYIRENYMEELDLQMVADQLYISTWHLCKVLKKETGNTFINILNQIRIDEARGLLKDTNLKVYEVAHRVGYSDITHFGRVFKQINGCTPSEYRNSLL